MNNTKRLAKNTAFMYVRMFFLMLITLYTSRVILRTLGLSDFGIYNVVGSIVVLFNSLRTIFASSTQRFLNYEMGIGNADCCNKVFNISIQINTLVSVLFFVLVEIVGLWFVNSKINVPPDRMIAVHWLLQFSIAGAIVSIYTTSFDALVIAHERMDYYAYMSVIEGLTKLMIAFGIGYYAGDKLILYGLLVFLTGLLVLVINYIFCRKSFSECRFKFVFDKEYMSKMSQFAGWNFFGNTAFAFSQSGINMVLNIFGGPVVNAARGLAYQVNNMLGQVLSNIGIVMRPYMVKTYAEGENGKLLKPFHLLSKLYFLVQLCLVTVFSFFAEPIISLWLGKVPEYVIPFLTIVLWHSLIRALHAPIDILFHASGNLKHYQLCEGIVLSLPVVFSYLLLLQGLPYTTVFYLVLTFELVNFACILKIADNYDLISMKRYVRDVIVPCSISCIIYIVPYYVIQPIGIFLKFIISFTSLFCIIFSMLFIGFNKQERSLLFSIVYNSKRNN